MKLSTKSRYATRLMVNLAFSYQKGPIQLNEIAKKEDVSEKYLSQLVIQLRAAGLIRSIRGAKGGYLLTKAPSAISLKDIVETMEGGLNIVDCLGDAVSCSKSEKCVSRHVWEKVTRAIKETLDGITLEELASLVDESDRPMYYI